MTIRQRLRSYGYAALYAMGGILIVLLIVAIAENNQVLDAIRSSQQDRAPILDSTAQSAKDTARSTKLIESCLLPHRPCSRRAAKNTKAVLQQVADETLYIALCEGHHPETVDELRACVVATAAADHH